MKLMEVFKTDCGAIAVDVVHSPDDGFYGEIIGPAGQILHRTDVCATRGEAGRIITRRIPQAIKLLQEKQEKADA